MIRTFVGYILVVVSMFHCTSTEKKESAANRETSNLSPEEKKFLDEYKAEIELGRNMSGRLIAFYGSYSNGNLLRYVNTVGNYVAQNGDYPNRRYMFAILDNESVNAFACPGGYILVTVGAIRHAQNEAELAAVLGHEVAHVGKQHMFKTLKAMDNKSLDEASKAPEPSSEFARARMRPRPEQSQIANEFMKILNAATGSTGLNLLKAAQAGMNLILEKGLDQKLELEADREGAKYAIRSGYDPKALAKFLARLEKEKKQIKEKDVLDKTHPPLAKRQDEIDKVLKEMNADTIVGAYQRKRFLTYAAMLPPKKSKSQQKDKDAKDGK